MIMSVNINHYSNINNNNNNNINSTDNINLIGDDHDAKHYK